MEGDRGIRVERDAICSALITGDVNVNVQFGLTFAPASFRGRVQRFLSYYLGSESRPVPFGGRTAQLEQLDAWLANSDATPTLLIIAPAGRGKTALLVRWLQRIDAAAWSVAFVPISIRFETNRPDIFYQALAARLAYVLGKDFEEATGDAAAVYKDNVIELLDELVAHGKRCLLVIDGLDEAKGWRVDTSVLPPDPMPGLRIIVGARLLADHSRPQDWLRLVGWRASDCCILEVPQLDRDGVADVLRAMDVPLGDLAAKVDLLGELERLTEGDPLLLRFYVEDLWENRDRAAGLRPEELRGREAGFGPYFKGWLDKQGGIYSTEGAAFDEQTIKAILLILACAFGPLRLADLVHLVRRVLGSERIISRDSLEPIQRFLIGGPHEDGYVLGHPKLGSYLREDFFGGSEDVARAKHTFVAWGAETVRRLNAGELEPEKAPPYLLQFYAQHLQEANPAPDQFLELIENGWRRAWEAHEDGFQGFISDVHLVWTVIKHGLSGDCTASLRSQLLGSAIRCALCHSSIRSLGINMPPSLLEAWLQHGIITSRQAFHLAELEEHRYRRRRAFASILPHLEAPTYSHALTCAVHTLEEIDNPEISVELLAKLAALAEPSLLDHLLEIADKISQDEERAQAIANIALHLTDDHEKAKVFSKVLAVARSIPRASLAKALVLAGLALHRPKVESALPSADDLFSEALAVAGSNVEALVQLALSGSAFERHEQAVEAAFAAARTSSDPGTRARALARLAILKGNERDAILDEAVAAARAVSGPYHRPCALIAISSMVDGARREVLVNKAFEGAEDQRFVSLVIALTYYSAQALGDEDKVYINKMVGGSITFLRGHASQALPHVLTNLAARFGVWHKPSNYSDILAPLLSSESLQRAWESSQHIFDSGVRLKLLRAIVDALPGDQRSEQADAVSVLTDRLWKETLAIPDQTRKVRELREFASDASEKQVAEIFEATMEIEDLDVRARDLGLLAPYISATSVEEALVAVREASGNDVRASALAKLAMRLSDDDERDAVLDEAEAAVIAPWNSEGGKGHTLLEIALGFSDKRRESALLRGFELARQFGGEWERAVALSVFAPHLDDVGKCRDALNEVLAIARGMNEHDQMLLLSQVLPTVSKEFPEEAINAVMALPLGFRSGLVATIAPNLSHLEQKAIVDQAFEDALGLENPGGRDSALSGLAPYLSEELLPRAITALRSVPDSGARGRAFVKFAHHTDGQHRAECVCAAIEAALEYQDSANRAALLTEILPLSGDRFLQVFSYLTECWFRLGRPGVLGQIERVLPALREVGGPATLRSIFVSVRDVSEWWP